MILSFYSFKDFSLPVVFGHTVIISRKISAEVSGNFITAIFDLPTALCFMASVLLVILSLWTISRLSLTSNKRFSFWTLVIYCIGATCCQGLPKTVKFCSIGRALVTLFCIYTLVFTAIYSGINCTWIIFM